MRKNVLLIAFFALFVCSLNAENLKIKIEGPERAIIRLELLIKQIMKILNVRFTN